MLAVAINDDDPHAIETALRDGRFVEFCPTSEDISTGPIGLVNALRGVVSSIDHDDDEAIPCFSSLREMTEGIRQGVVFIASRYAGDELILPFKSWALDHLGFGMVSEVFRDDVLGLQWSAGWGAIVAIISASFWIKKSTRAATSSSEK